MSARGLYAIVDPAATRARDPEVIAKAILAGGCARLQLRFKDGPDRARLALAQRVRALCAEAGVPFVVNDRPDLALLTKADGLHLGQDDLPIAAARSLVPEAEIGLSTHDPAQARAAEAAGADVVAFGPIFPTTSKAEPDPVVGLDALAAVCRATSRPVVAIGGLSLERAPAIRDAGAAWGAVIGAVCGADDPEAAARALHHALGGEAS
ncbi:MAG: thiamine phosphate synthase [Sandaracinaceae bacterium]|nr:thiamine phosphate synthase [Sandaracinaceae bacterium]